MSDSASFLARQIMKALGANYPIRIAVAVGLAQIMGLLARVWHIQSPDSSIAGIASSTSFWIYLCIAISIWFIPLLFNSNGAPEYAVEQINTIELIMNRGQLTKTQRALIWRSLLEKYVKAARPDLGNKPDLLENFKEAATEVASSDSSQG